VFLITRRRLWFPANLTASWTSAERSRVDANYRHASLLARESRAKRVQVAALDGPVREGVRLEVGVFGAAPGWSERQTPSYHSGADLGAVSWGGIVARRGWWDWVEQRLREP
jgi:hypothetical protein